MKNLMVLILMVSSSAFAKDVACSSSFKFGDKVVVSDKTSFYSGCNGVISNKFQYTECKYEVQSLCGTEAESFTANQLTLVESRK